MTTNQACCNIEVNKEVADYRYVYYWLKNNYHQLRNLSSGVRKNLNSDDLKNFPFNYKEPNTQNKIAGILSALDEKISLNNRINTELETMAKTIYNYWFVQFDFPNEEGKPYKTSGGEMEHDEELKREIPKGWVVEEIKNIVDVKDGTHDSPKYVLENGIPFVTQKNITKEGLSFDDIQLISREDHIKIIKRSNVEFGDIIISMIGANRGMSCVIDDNREFSIKNVGLIKSLGKINHTYLLYFLKSATAQEYISLMSSGGAQQFIGLTILRKFPVPMPAETEQAEIVERIEEEQSLVNGNKKLIQLYEQKIKNKINEVWGVKEEVEV